MSENHSPFSIYLFYFIIINKINPENTSYNSGNASKYCMGRAFANSMSCYIQVGPSQPLQFPLFACKLSSAHLFLFLPLTDDELNELSSLKNRPIKTKNCSNVDDRLPSCFDDVVVSGHII